MMKKLLFKYFWAMFFMFHAAACGRSQETVVSGTDDKPKKAPTEKPVGNPLKPKKMPLLNQKNVEEELLRYGRENPETKVLIETRLGNIELRLYEDVPLHRANFVMLVKRGYYNETLFYRIIKNFMIQGGDSDDLKFRAKKRAIGKYQIPPEMSVKRFHKRGAVAMARDYANNPGKLSTPFDFYIVQAGPVDPESLAQTAQSNGLEYTAAQKRVYLSSGGTPHLDNQHTVFGEVVSGMETVDAIADIPTGLGDWPSENVMVSMKLLD